MPPVNYLTFNIPFQGNKATVLLLTKVGGSNASYINTLSIVDNGNIQNLIIGSHELTNFTIADGIATVQFSNVSPTASPSYKCCIIPSLPNF